MTSEEVGNTARARRWMYGEEKNAGHRPHPLIIALFLSGHTRTRTYIHTNSRAHTRTHKHTHIQLHARTLSGPTLQGQRTQNAHDDDDDNATLPLTLLGGTIRSDSRNTGKAYYCIRSVLDMSLQLLLLL